MPDPFDFDLFIGYAGPDRAHAEALCAAARAAGLRVFIDLDLLAGDDVTIALPDALERSRVFAWIVSPRSDKGWYDKDEAGHAVELQRKAPEQRRLVPIHLGDAPRGYGVRHLVSIDLPDPPAPEELEAAAARLADAVAAARAADPPPEPAPDTTRRLPPALPALTRPYPLLDPYSHPALFAGRSPDRRALLALLDPANAGPVIQLYAPSGAGKSSLLRAGLLPALRGQLDPDAEPRPVAFVDDPHQPRLVARLLAQLVQPAPTVADEAPGAIAAAFAAVPGGRPICVLDQFEEIFKSGDPLARARAGLAIAATMLGSTRRVRWILAYRDDFHGRVCLWLRDLLAEARAAGWPIAGLRPDLEAARALKDHPLPLFGAARGADPHAAARAAFHDAITRPLAVPDAPWRWTIASETAAALADAFAAARTADTPDSAEPPPLVPELQVVLARLMAEAGDDHVIRLAPEADEALPDAARRVIDRALQTHLGAALDQALGTWRKKDRAAARQLVLIALKRLSPARRRGPALPAPALTDQIGHNAGHILETLAHPARRVLVQEAADDPADTTRWCRLSHDRMAEAVHAEIDGLMGGLAEDDPLRLEDFVATNSALFARGEADAAELNPGRRKAIDGLPDAFIEADEDRRRWWGAVQAHARRQRRRRVIIAGLAAVALVAGALALAWWIRERTIGEQLASSDPTTQWRGLVARVDAGGTPDEAAAQVPPMDIVGRRLLLAETFPDVDPALECPILRALIERFAPQVGATADFGALLAAAQRLGLLARDASTACGPSAEGARSLVVRHLRAKYGEPPAEVHERLQWRPVPVDERPSSFRCTIGSPLDEAGRHEDETIRQITLTRFEIMDTEVTNRLYRHFQPTSGLHKHADARARTSGSRLDHPATVNWYDATAFAVWVGGRLPTEAEWECAARAGERTAYWSGHDTADLKSVGWTIENSRSMAHPVRSRKPNEWKLFDVHGNVWEWTADWYQKVRPPRDARDPAGPISGTHRVRRGGSFASVAGHARAASRSRHAPGVTNAYVGFRVVRPTPAR